MVVHHRLFPLGISVLALALLVAAGRDVVGLPSAEPAPTPDTNSPVASAAETSADTASLASRDTPSVALALVGTYVAPVEIAPSPRTGTDLVVELAGTIRTLSDEPVLIADLTHRTLVEGERGLLGAAVDPDDDLLYVHHTDLDGATVVAELAIDPVTGVADAASYRVVFRIEQPYDNHNGGELTFGPDGMLYLGLGDGGLANDPLRAALDLSTPLGSILRFDPAGAVDGEYTVPEDNPFVEVAGADERIWSYGLRNPWRFSFDPATGDLWIADVGQDRFEEVNVAAVDPLTGTAGGAMSFGWSARDGAGEFHDDEPDGDHIDPVLVTDHENGNCSISGGAVHRDPAAPMLDGWYVYADYCTGRVSAVDTAVLTAGTTLDAAAETLELGIVEQPVAVAAGVGDATYVVSAGGNIYRIITG